LKLFGTSWLGLFETPITADKREIKDFPQIAFGNFFYPPSVIRHTTRRLLNNDTEEEQHDGVRELS